jgi:hypothetical protein
MQSLEIDATTGGSGDGDEEETVPLTHSSSHGRPRHEFPSLVASARSSTTLGRQCLALLLIAFGTFFCTTIVFHIGQKYKSPWYYRPGNTGMPLSDLLKLQRPNSTSNFTTTRNVTHSKAKKNSLP